MIKYIKCPRCDLNYIDSEKQEYCDVCLAELHGAKLQFADLDVDDVLDEELAEEEATEVCPICGVNRMRAGEQMCDECKKNEEYVEDEVDTENDEEWKNYLDEDDAEGDLTVDDEELAEELDGEDEEEESSESDDDDFESEDVDSLSDLDDDDFDDDDDDFDDDDDEDDF